MKNLLIILLAITSMLLTSCTTNMDIKSILNSGEHLDVYIYENGEIQNKYQLLPNNIKFKKMINLGLLNKNGWNTTYGAYAPFILVRGTNFSINFQYNRVILNCSKGQYIKSISPDEYQFLLNRNSSKIVLSNTKALEFNNEINKLAKLKAVDGKAVYYAGLKGKFYKLYEIFIVNKNEKDFLKMLKNKSPAVRIMGALCLAQKNKPKYEKDIKKLYNDKEKIDFFPHGCCGSSETTGNIIKQIMINPNILE